MLTPRQNVVEVMRGGNPDRFVKQFEFFEMVMDPLPGFGGMPEPGGTAVDDWGVTTIWPEGVITPFPMHDDEHKVVKDIRHWRDYVHAPSLETTDEAWADAIEAEKSWDRESKWYATFAIPGLFEKMHYLMSMNDALVNFYEAPDEMHELIDFYVDFLCRRCETVFKYISPDMLMYGDDMGTHRSTFISPEMYKEFFLPGVKKIIGLCREKGVELVYYHNDSYSATLVPYFIEAGIDIWQGPVTNNNVSELIKEYGGQITFMGDIDSGIVDTPEWTPEIIEREVRRACTENGKLYFIPSMTMAMAPGLYEGVTECIDENIDKMTAEMF